MSTVAAPALGTIIRAPRTFGASHRRENVEVTTVIDGDPHETAMAVGWLVSKAHHGTRRGTVTVTIDETMEILAPDLTEWAGAER